MDANSAFSPNNLIDINTPSTPDQININVPDIQSASIPNVVIAESRANKAYTGLMDVIGQSYQEIQQQFATGQENSFRKGASLAVDAQETQKRLDALQKAMAKGVTLTPDQVKAVMDGGVFSDPDTVVEKAYGEKYASTINQSADRIQDTILDQAAVDDPEQLKKYFSQSSDLIAKREWWLRKAEDIEETQVKSQSRIGYWLDQGKQLIPGYNEWKNRGNAPGVGMTTGILLGENEEAQGMAYLRMPLADMTKAATATLDKLTKDNPSLAASFARSMAGMSTTDKVMNDLMTPLEVVGGVDTFKLAKGVGLRAEGVRRAYKDIVKSTNVPEVTKATIAEGAGDLKEAAVQQSVSDDVKAVKTPASIGDIQTQANIETLTSNIKAQTDKWTTDLTISREQYTRLKSQQDGFLGRLVDLVTNVAKVERVPWITATEDGRRILMEKVKEYYKGWGNSILDIDVRQDELSGAWVHDIKVGAYDGGLHATPEAAMAHADMNGAAKPVIAGKSVDKVYFSADELKDFREIQIGSDKLPNVITDTGSTLRYTTKPAEGLVPFNRTTGQFEKALTSDQVKLEQQGLGYYYVISKPLNETETFIRDGLIYGKEAKSTSSDTGWRAQANSLLGWVRGASDTLSIKETEQRVKTAYVQSKFLQLAKEEMKFVEDVVRGRIKTDPITGEPMTRLNGKIRQYTGKITGGNKEVFEQFNRALDYARKAEDPVTKLPGYFFQTPSELHNFYTQAFSRAPSFEETQAYFAFTRAYEYDLALRNIRSYTNKMRLGAERWSLQTMKAETGPESSAWFDAVQRKSVPRTEDTMLFHKGNGDHRILNSSSIPKAVRDDIEDGVKTGRYKIVEIYDPEARVLNYQEKGGINARIRYVVSDNLSSKPLEMDQVGRRGGGHFEYDYDHYIKQPKVRPEWSGGKLYHWYEGDQTLMPIDNTAKGRDVAAKFNQVRKLIKDGKSTEAKAFVQANLDVPWKDIQSWFRPTKDQVTGKMNPARFNLDHDFEVVSKGASINEKSAELRDKFWNKNRSHNSFVDGTRHGSLARNFQVAYTGERDAYDLFSLKNEGNRYNPVYKYEPAKMLDPIPTLTRALDRITNSMYMDDYKIYAAEHWLQENYNLLKEDQEVMRSAPFHYFNNINNASFRRDAPKEMVGNALSNWYKAKQLIGTPDTFMTGVHQIKTFLHDSAYEKYGPRGDSLVPDWMLDRVRSPVDFARSMAFHTKLGLFNPAQILTQSMTYLNIFALAPKSAVQGSLGALFHQWSRINRNPEIVAGLGKYAEKFGWKAGHFEEAMRTLDRTGFANVGGEFSLDNAMRHYYIRNGVRQFLDAGQIFFKEAERNFRYGAWYTAFHEYRLANPVSKIGDKELGQILRRADDLTTNMSRASNSILSKGILSVPTQFLTYQIRLAEQFWSKRIGETLAERTKRRALLFGIYSTMFGVPGAMGLSGLPIGDYWRKAALENGYVVGEDGAYSLMYEGLPSLIGALITGDGDFKTGNWYNWNDKLGANGFSPFKDILRSDATWYKILGGASGSVIGNTLADMDGLWHAVKSMVSGQPEDEAFPMKLDDWMRILNEASSFSQARRLIYALEFGKWQSKNEAFITDTSKANAVFMALTGLQPQQLDDAYTKLWTKREEKEAYKEAVNRFTREFHRAYDSDNDPEQFRDYMRRAFSELSAVGYPKEKWVEVIQSASRGYESLINGIDYNYYFKDVPDNRRDKALDAYVKQLQINRAKEQ